MDSGKSLLDTFIEIAKSYNVFSPKLEFFLLMLCEPVFVIPGDNCEAEEFIIDFLKPENDIDNLIKWYENNETNSFHEYVSFHLWNKMQTAVDKYLSNNTETEKLTKIQSLAFFIMYILPRNQIPSDNAHASEEFSEDFSETDSDSGSDNERTNTPPSNPVKQKGGTEEDDYIDFLSAFIIDPTPRDPEAQTFVENYIKPFVSIDDVIHCPFIMIPQYDEPVCLYVSYLTMILTNHNMNKILDELYNSEEYKKHLTTLNTWFKSEDINDCWDVKLTLELSFEGGIFYVNKLVPLQSYIAFLLKPLMDNKDQYLNYISKIPDEIKPIEDKDIIESNEDVINELNDNIFTQPVIYFDVYKFTVSLAMLSPELFSIHYLVQNTEKYTNTFMKAIKSDKKLEILNRCRNKAPKIHRDLNGSQFIKDILGLLYGVELAFEQNSQISVLKNRSTETEFYLVYKFPIDVIVVNKCELEKIVYTKYYRSFIKLIFGPDIDIQNDLVVIGITPSKTLTITIDDREFEFSSAMLGSLQNDRMIAGHAISLIKGDGEPPNFYLYDGHGYYKDSGVSFVDHYNRPQHVLLNDITGNNYAKHMGIGKSSKFEIVTKDSLETTYYYYNYDYHHISLHTVAKPQSSKPLPRKGFYEKAINYERELNIVYSLKPVILYQNKLYVFTKGKTIEFYSLLYTESKTPQLQTINVEKNIITLAEKYYPIKTIRKLSLSEVVNNIQLSEKPPKFINTSINLNLAYSLTYIAEDNSETTLPIILKLDLPIPEMVNNFEDILDSILTAKDTAKKINRNTPLTSEWYSIISCDEVYEKFYTICGISFNPFDIDVYEENKQIVKFIQDLFTSLLINAETVYQNEYLKVQIYNIILHLSHSLTVINSTPPFLNYITILQSANIYVEYETSDIVTYKQYTICINIFMWLTQNQFKIKDKIVSNDNLKDINRIVTFSDCINKNHQMVRLLLYLIFRGDKEKLDVFLKLPLNTQAIYLRNSQLKNFFIPSEESEEREPKKPRQGGGRHKKWTLSDYHKKYFKAYFLHYHLMPSFPYTT